MHDLLRAYVRELATVRNGSGQAKQALTRLSDYYLAAATAAMNVAFPAEADCMPVFSETTLVLPEMPGEAEARAWLDPERANLTAVVPHCAGHGWPQHATKLAGALYKYLLDSGHVPEAEVIYRHSTQAARRQNRAGRETRPYSAVAGQQSSPCIRMQTVWPATSGLAGGRWPKTVTTLRTEPDAAASGR